MTKPLKSLELDNLLGWLLIRANQVNELIDRIKEEGTYDFSGFKVHLDANNCPDFHSTNLKQKINKHFEIKYPPGDYPSYTKPFPREAIAIIPRECLEKKENTLYKYLKTLFIIAVLLCSSCQELQNDIKNKNDDDYGTLTYIKSADLCFVKWYKSQIGWEYIHIPCTEEVLKRIK